MQETNEKLSEKKCRACEGTEKSLGEAEISKYLNELGGWALTNEETLLFREYTMNNFMDAVAFIQQIAGIAEEEGHYPDLHLTNYKKLRIELSTHAIGSLSENDFIMAAKINEIPLERLNIIDVIKRKGEERVSGIPHREEYINFVQNQIDTWQSRIQDLKDKTYTIEVNVRVKYEEQLYNLGEKIIDAEKKIEEIRKTSDEAWKTVSEGTYKAWDEIKTSVEEAFSKLKNEKG